MLFPWDIADDLDVAVQLMKLHQPRVGTSRLIITESASIACFLVWREDDHLLPRMRRLGNVVLRPPSRIGASTQSIAHHHAALFVGMIQTDVLERLSEAPFLS